MENKYYTMFAAAMLISAYTQAQSSFTTKEYIDINNIKAAVLVHGDMWWDPVSGQPQCEVPKGSGKNASHASGIWMGAYDASNKLHVSAQTYRQVGNDYWPGPLDANDTLTYEISEKWAKIWKVNRADINTHITNTTHSPANTPAGILDWPAKGNAYARGNAGAILSINDDMAPYVDVDNDGKYDALKGDYPNVKGDQALWWVFSDNGPTHDAASPKSTPLKVEVYAMAYAYKRGTLIDNVVYYEYTVHNRSGNNYNNFRFGVWDDADLGYPGDDYLGFDSARRMGIVYNSSVNDGGGSQPMGYGVNIPMMGLTFIELPGDGGGSYAPLGSFIYEDQYPTIDIHYNNHLRATFKSNAHIHNDFIAANIPTNGKGPGLNANFLFPGSLGISGQWTECASGNAGGERSFTLATKDYNFPANNKLKFTYAQMVTDTTKNHACPTGTFKDIRAVADTAWALYKPLGVSDTRTGVLSFEVYPNPAKNKLFVAAATNSKLQVLVYDAMGRKMGISAAQNGKVIEMNVSHLSAGMYYIVLANGATRQAETFIKE